MSVSERHPTYELSNFDTFSIMRTELQNCYSFKITKPHVADIA